MRLSPIYDFPEPLSQAILFLFFNKNPSYDNPLVFGNTKLICYPSILP
ncbi:MAG: hypothetical protein MH321_00805 [Leptospiraceae bacterium]|nr:hypothetical protein [Leptospiraceae bacterium]